MFSVNGFAGRKGVARYFGSAVAAIAASNIAATIAAAKRAGSSVELRTFVIGKLQKGDLINGIASGPIGDGWQQFPLWIKVPPTNLLLAISSRRCFPRRLPLKMAANKRTQPEGFMIPECLTASSAVGQAGSWILFIDGGDLHD
jgi:hypothetical protein